MSIDKNQRQRGSDEPDAPLLLEGDGAANGGDVVIGGEERNQGDHGAGGGFQQTLAIEVKWCGERQWEQRLGRKGRRL
ncbi:MAG: hypothetical protein ACO3ZD_11850 [Cyanobium sp.]